MPLLTWAAISIGVVTGVMLSWFGYQSGLFNGSATTGWPKRGLVIFVTHPETVVNIQERTGKNFTVGRTSKNGSLSIPDLPAGLYRLTLSAPGRIPVVKDVELDPEQAVVLGFPQRINLPAEY